MKTFTEWLELDEAKDAEKPKDKKTISKEQENLKRNKEHVERPGNPNV